MKKVLWAIFFILLMNGIAKAECAWVLWERSYPVPDEWMMINGFQTYDQCKKAKKDAYETKKRILSKMGWEVEVIEEMEDSLSMGLSGGGRSTSIYTRWMCLPDTLDPRK